MSGKLAGLEDDDEVAEYNAGLPEEGAAIGEGEGVVIEDFSGFDRGEGAVTLSVPENVGDASGGVARIEPVFGFEADLEGVLKADGFSSYSPLSSRMLRPPA